MRTPSRRRRAPKLGGWLLALSLSFSLVKPSFAQADPDELARRHFESGAAYFEQAEYEEALREFQKAYELSKRPQILRNISVVEERVGNIAGAVAALDEYLLMAPNDPDVDTVRIRRDNLKKRLEEEAAAPPVVAPDPTPPPPKEPAKPPPPREDPGPLTFDDGEFADEDSGPSLVPAYVLITVGALAGAGSGVTGYLAKSKHQELKDGCGATAQGCTDADVASGQTLALTSTVLTGVAVVGIGVGIIWWATAGSGSEETAARANSSPVIPQVDLLLGRNGGLGEARWTF